MQNDFEIYLKDSSKEQVWQWLTSVFPACQPWQAKGKVFKCRCGTNLINWYDKAVGSWHALLINHSQAPWQSDLDCAKSASSFLAIEVRCAPIGWQEKDGEKDADLWLKVKANQVESFLWRS